MNSRTNKFIASLIIIMAIIIIIFTALSFETGQPHCLNRGGALIAAFAALAIIFQIKFEIEIDQEKNEVESRTDQNSDLDTFNGPVERLTLLLKLKEDQRKIRALTRERLKIGAVVVICALSGELLHGFGDLILIFLFPLNFYH